MRAILRTGRRLGPGEPDDELPLPHVAPGTQQLEAIRQPKPTEEPGEADRRRLRHLAVAGPAGDEEANAEPSQRRRLAPQEQLGVVRRELPRRRSAKRPVAERPEVAAPGRDPAEERRMPE